MWGSGIPVSGLGYPDRWLDERVFCLIERAVVKLRRQKSALVTSKLMRWARTVAAAGSGKGK